MTEECLIKEVCGDNEIAGFIEQSMLFCTEPYTCCLVGPGSDGKSVLLRLVNTATEIGGA